MRADRLLSILMLLEVHRKMTADELARRLEVSERTIHRDMEALSAAGIPVYAERGAHGGWVLQEHYHFRLNGLKQDELFSLFVPLSARMLGELGMEPASEAALRKLSAALSPSLRRDADFARERLHIDGAGWSGRREEVPSLQLLHTAVWEERQVAFHYRKPGEAGHAAPAGNTNKTKRIVHPLGLVAKGQTWYLVAAEPDSATIKSFRISRIEAAELLPQPIHRPEGFELAHYWEQFKQELQSSLPKYMTTLRINQPALNKLKHTMFVRIENETADNDYFLVTADFQSLSYAIQFLAGYGAGIQVLEPEELRLAVIRHTSAILAMYESPASAPLPRPEPQ
ncbi:helix-turn-helix transcriptional regulator [Paenibacillus koleovorans]|uniref:helix-turn-helix transcriptional regulator n=1 Tax=Paenibacillus koleovorans TaxID=121608 RepID=UPI000FD7DA60|nr:YafY family protein [Paenibacillus koleovorans]